MVQATDILIDTSARDIGGVLFGPDGDLQIGFSDVQHELFIFGSYPGWYRENLVCGIGIGSYLKSVGTELILQRICRIQLERDNYEVEKLTIGPNYQTHGYDIETKLNRIR